MDSQSWSITWGELRKCRARTKSSERSGVGSGGDDDDACSDEELGGGVSVERGLDSDEVVGGCELSSLLAVIARLKRNGPVSRATGSWFLDMRTDPDHALQLIPIHHKLTFLY